MKTLKTTLEVEAATARGLHPISNATGLFLQISKGGSKSWVFRYRLNGTRRIMGLGSSAKLSLAEARKAATAAASLRDAGTDPIAAKREKRAAAIAASRPKAAASKHTFRVVAEEFIANAETGWKRRDAGRAWRNPFAKWVYPTLGDIEVSAITLDDVATALKPAWEAVPETARRMRGRIEAILDRAAVLGYRDVTVQNPASIRLVKHKLKAKPRITRHFRAPSLDETPALFQKIAVAPGSAARCLEFMILTTARPGEAQGATWAEMDLTKALWTLPATRMKSRRPHVVPLVAEALAVLDRQAQVRSGDFVFPGARPDAPLCYDSLPAALARMGITSVTPHGWRSAFRDAAGDLLDVPRDLAEAQLAHSLGTVEASYRRLTAVEQRRAVLSRYVAWLKGELKIETLGTLIAFPGTAAVA
jgi:integrase